MILFSQNDFDGFQKWIELNISNITWEGRYEKEFNEFWNYFFIEGLSLKQTMIRFEFAKRSLKTGPLSSWFAWLKEKFICYSFIYKGLSIRELEEQTNISFTQISLLLRDFFVERYPY